MDEPTNPPDPPTASDLRPMFSMLAFWTTEWLVLQRLQMDSLYSLQRSLVTSQQDAWEAWACRWGGGAPLDG